MENRAAFEALRAQLKKAGCRVTALDEAIAEELDEEGGRGPTQIDILLELASSADPFHSPDTTGFADPDINGHRETWPVRSKGFRRWLARRFHETTQGAPSSEALQSTLNGRSGREPPRTFWAPWPRWRASASPNPRPGPIALGRWRADCAGRLLSYVRSVSRSVSGARAGRGPARFSSPPPQAIPRQKMRGRYRPHRPHRPAPKSNSANGFAASPLRTVANDADGPADGGGRGGAPTVRANPLKTNGGTAADGADANRPAQSAPGKTGAPGWRARL
jgi:hypothetical protein